METKISTAAWQQSLALKPSPLIFNIPYEKVDIYPVLQDLRTNQSFIHSQKLKESIFESKKAFLNESLNDGKAQAEQTEVKPFVGVTKECKRSTPCKKVSFKIKKQSSLYRRNVSSVSKVATIPQNTVAELTKKFNEMVNSRSFWEEEKVKLILKRGDSINSDKDKGKRITLVHKDSVKVSRKPSVKTKPSVDSTNVVIIKTCKSSFKKQKSDKINISANMSEKRKPELPPSRPTTLNLNLNKEEQILETSPNGTSVKAAIQIFEKRSSVSLPVKSEVRPNTKPLLPDKSAALRNLNSTLQRKVRSRATEASRTTGELHKKIESVIESNKQKEKEIKKTDNTDGEFSEDKVEVINIPAVLPQRRCDSMYETLNMKKVHNPQTLKSVSVDNLSSEIKTASVLPNNSFLWRDKSPSSTSSRSSINTQFQEKILTPEENKPLPRIPSNRISRPLSTIKIIRNKMPLPESPVPDRKQEAVSNDEAVDYEEIGFAVDLSEKSSTNDEKFKGCDEITKEVNDFEVVDNLTQVGVASYVEDQKIDEDEKHYEVISKEEKFYEELSNMSTKIDDGYEPIGNHNQTDEREIIKNPGENIYETLPVHSVTLRKQKPLPPTPSTTSGIEEAEDNCYESIYTKKEGFYESIYGSQLTTDSGSNRDSVLSSDQKTNSLYGQPIPVWEYHNDSTYYKPVSDVSDQVSDRSDEWEDVTDNEETENTFIVVREKHKGRKSGWSQHFREQLSKSLKDGHAPLGEDNSHHYESLYTAKEDEDFAYDSFESDTESETSVDRIRIVDDSGIGIPTSRLPETPNNQSYRLMKFAEKNMKKLRRNFTMNLTKSFTRMRKHISKTDNDTITGSNKDITSKSSKQTDSIYQNVETRNPSLKPIIYTQPIILETPPTPESQPSDDQEKCKAILRNKEGFLTKFRRSMSLSTESALEVTSTLNRDTKTKSTFYLTDAISVDGNPNECSDNSLSPVIRHKRSPLMRPKSPPPPIPTAIPDLNGSNRKNSKTTSWYADSGVFRNKEQPTARRPNTYWYAEVGLYRSQNSSTPSTSSAENSGSNLSTPIKPIEISRPVVNSDFINHDDNENYNNLMNENLYYPDSVNSFSSIDTKKDESLKQDIQLRLQDEPLYQFYDAAVLESINYADTSDLDSDNYEDVSEKHPANNVVKIRPSAMELVSPKRNSICFTKTLWCEIPEVINSAVLSTLNPYQKKLQEAKFEILTSEASYLNSLNVLNDHFITSFHSSPLITTEECNILFAHVAAVRNSSEKLLHDLEKCWQDNILLHGICDIVQKHAEENFNVYVPYCENQILFDDILKNLKDRMGFTEFLKRLEQSEACQSLTLYSFLMLPMQRITRWPLLVDAVLKRLPQQDSEYYACQFALATVNKIVSQCNEAARQKERETEMLKISKLLEFPPTVPKIPLLTTDRWLVRCGSVVHMQSRNEDSKLTFGKRFSKTAISLYLFNDLFIVAKEKGEKTLLVQQYCPRNMVELATSDTMLFVPAKEAQNKHLIFLTILENQDGKTIEYMLSCSSESDKERWVEALSPPKSEDPGETLYECWDCPQVLAIHNYTANQPDELGLTKGDVINVLRKLAEGWYHGERLRDSQTGWFPANHTVEIANYHVRARNLKQRYRLLAYSENYLKSK